MLSWPRSLQFPTQWPWSWPSNLQPTLTLTTLTLTTAIAIILPRAYRNYKIYMSYGPGGTPYNIVGWFIVAAILTPTGSYDLTSASVYEKKIENGESESYLSEATLRLLSEKTRERPTVGPHIAPQRQLDELPEEEVKKLLDDEYFVVAKNNSHLVRLDNSPVEKHPNAMLLAEGVARNEPARRMHDECAHLHRSRDYSLHVVLAPADCKKIFDAGWGQRHGWSGLKAPHIWSRGKILALPSEFVFIYAPRTEEEVALVIGILKAGLRYMTGQEVR
ncbi:hypothetical protein BO71DRAFT_397520 [Aspergillus ellipticus CBS 707.79]|uniref:Luciferase domain-containing protein n=1 Tax=Aspergillus ellipticus CBS 707.79 TaxID=1448320 RepID=A0A319EWN1_9EURO|nr:hypothetical protein BO71DRAFT_397520 [Aspergillus ellipticus CBS 707.79]